MFTRVKYGGIGLPYNYSYFLCDSASDIADLPINANGVSGCSFASKAFVIETQETYILSNNNTWVLLSSSGSNGSSIGTDNVASVSEVRDYLGI